MADRAWRVADIVASRLLGERVQEFAGDREFGDGLAYLERTKKAREAEIRKEAREFARLGFCVEDDEFSDPLDDGEEVNPDEQARNLSRLRSYLDRIKAISSEVEAAIAAGLGPPEMPSTSPLQRTAATLKHFGRSGRIWIRWSEGCLKATDK